jgi:hypothetical protein
VERVRWLLTFVAIVFVAVLGAMESVNASAAPAPQAAAAAAAPDPSGSGEDGEWDEGEWDWDEGEAEASQDEGEAPDECEFEDEAREEACEEALEEKEVEAAEAEECRLDSAEATVAAMPSRNQVRLTLRYRTFEPSAVSIDLGLRGAKGTLDLGSDSARFGLSGTLHTTETLTDSQMERAMAAKEFTVGVYALNTPDSCRQSFERHLTASKAAGAGKQWSDPSATRRAKSARAKS